MLAFIIKPKLISIDTIIVPPYEINGNGTPTTGIIPITIPILINTWLKNIDIRPITINFVNIDLVLIAIASELIITMKYNIIKIKPPIKPSSSVKKEKMKSVVYSGRKLKWLCVPFNNPFPQNPPDPIAILDWIMLKC